MRKYLIPEVEIVMVEASDVITSSPGTETPLYEENDGIWEFNLDV